MSESNYSKMLMMMERIAEALEQANKETNPARKHAILNAAAFDCEMAMRIKGLDDVAIRWFTDRWALAGEAIGKLSEDGLRPGAGRVS